MDSIPEASLDFLGLFEAEVFVQLLLERWNHPLAQDEEFRNDLIEGAVGVLTNSLSGEPLIECVPPSEMNIIAAIWYVEWAALDTGAPDPDEKRHTWLGQVRRALPSCFAAQDLLG